MMDTGNSMCAYYNSANGYIQQTACNNTDPAQSFSWSDGH